MAFGKSSKDPFSTPVGHLIDIHTASTLQNEDWGQFMNICDVINTTADGPKDAVKAFRKRICRNYNQKEVKFSLLLLEMCMQNCVPTFHSLVLKKDFSKDVLVKMLNPKYNLPVSLQNKILFLIMTWSHDPKWKINATEIREVYLELIKRGIKFPSLQENGEMLETQESPKQSIQSPLSHHSKADLHNLTPEQIGKLYSEMDMVRMNVKVMSEILLETRLGAENPEDMDLLEELHKACLEMQRRILTLVETVQNEDVIIELVQVNDDLNNVFLRHERFSRAKANQSAEHRRQAEIMTFDDNGPTAPLSELIDLNVPSGPVHPVHSNGFLLPAPTMPMHPWPTHTPHFPDKSGLENRVPFLYPQMDLQGLREAVDTRFELGVQLPEVPPQNIYDNTPAEPTLLPTVPALSPTVLLIPNNPTSKQLAENKSGASENNSLLPNYYELLEFDPLAESNRTEVIYEEIDTSLWRKTANSGAEC
ncbi:hypothetical protein XENTR_v10003951 [Xenopus tropicalis]|uniref:TOM1-like protein 1 isoform X1 n=2 Tax=Xenopus tropicalis TaxID=8364 RepID=F6PP54_XENTR|nr:TOM1-like protein 1 isoform X1 [Xenopus tropicalis]KAE8575823.1 hypothetical protein XENTR_v10003951 [Xenopus tropicalis]